MTNKHILLGTSSKAINLEDMPEEAWRYLAGGDQKTADRKKAFREIPWVSRGVHLRGNGVASLPFVIKRGDNLVDNSEEYQNAVGFFKAPRRLLNQVEQSLTLFNRAYAFRKALLNRTIELRYMVPNTITPKINQITGLEYFERVIGGKPKRFEIEQVVYWWAADGYVEVGPSDNSPVVAALRAAGVLINMDEFIAGYFARGAIKATLLTVEGAASADERNLLREWWRRAFGGKAWASEVVNAAVKPVIVGEGLESLSNKELSKEKREDIATALGIPQSMLFSQAANFATAREDKKQFYEQTIIPEAELIEEVLNEQVFGPSGYQFKFAPQSLDVFQEEEKDRATAFVNYAQFIKPSVTAGMLGLDLPEGTDMEEIDQTWLDIRTRSDVRYGQTVSADRDRDMPAAKTAEVDDLGQELERWQRKALKRVKQHGKAACTFESEVIPAVLAAAIEGSLETVSGSQAEMAVAVKSIFGDALRWEGYP
jgi:HK97 family phage portal protein